jgi:hypothetical protein
MSSPQIIAPKPVISSVENADFSPWTDFIIRHEPRTQLARRRQAALWRHERPDAWPILFHAPLTPEQKALPNPDFAQAFRDPDSMTFQQLRGALSVLNAAADGVPSVRVNFGTGVLLSCLGLEQLVFPDKMPWLQDHLTPQQAQKLTIDDIQIRGSFARGLEVMKHFRQTLGDSVPVYCMDTQGPFDLAHLLLGDEIFYLMTDEPKLLHHVMEICLELGIRAHRWMKEVSGEANGALHHSNDLYAENMGIRICEDTTAIISPQAMDEFAMPYTRRLAKTFEGAWVHYCGRNDHLTKRILEIPEVRGINFGHIPGHESDHDFEADMRLIRESGKIYYGTWPRLAQESGMDYLKRMHRFSREGALLVSGDPSVGAHGFPDIASARDFWYGLG